MLGVNLGEFIVHLPDVLENELTGNGREKDKTCRFYLLENPDGVFGALDDSLLQHTDVRSRDS